MKEIVKEVVQESVVGVEFDLEELIEELRVDGFELEVEQSRLEFDSVKSYRVMVNGEEIHPLDVTIEIYYNEDD